MNELELTGQIDTHLKHVEDPKFSAQPVVVNAFLKMNQAAAEAGFLLHPVSAYRDLQSQLKIWNAKFDGDRPLYTAEGEELDPSSMVPEAILTHILRWSALPGGSRHHWGTEFDVIDSNAVPDGYQVKLLPDEFAEGGIFYRLNNWLDVNIARFGFFRPYRTFKGGVLPEPWHLSFASIAKNALYDLSFDVLEDVIKNLSIRGQAEVLEMLPNIYNNYILNIDSEDSLDI